MKGFIAGIVVGVGITLFFAVFALGRIERMTEERVRSALLSSGELIEQEIIDKARELLAEERAMEAGMQARKLVEAARRGYQGDSSGVDTKP